MSRRGIHPLLMGVNRHKAEKTATTPLDQSQETSGLESAQRKRFLRSESEETPQNIEG